jgi:UDP-N-acetylmuramate--alanine ligase
LLEIYPAGEAPIVGVTGIALAEAINTNVQLITNSEKLPEIVAPMLRDKDILLTLGAGNIGAIATNLFNILRY